MAGALGVLFNRSLIGTIEAYARLPSPWLVPAAAITGGVVGCVGWFYPLTLGSGHGMAESALRGELLLSVVPLFFLIRFR